jgi:hypothetical protein
VPEVAVEAAQLEIGRYISSIDKTNRNSSTRQLTGKD